MENNNKAASQEPAETQPDKNLAAEERPVPSQAEGDLETVDADLEDEKKKS